MGWRIGWVLIAALPIAFLAIFFAWPAGNLIAKGFFSTGSFSLSGNAVFESARTWRAIIFTLLSAGASTLVSILLGVPGAYVLYRLDFRGQSLLRALITIPFVLPTVAVGLAFSALFRPEAPFGWLGLDGTAAAIIIAMVFFNYCVVVRTVGSFWARLDPKLGAAAATLGSSPGAQFRRVELPALSPAILSAASLVFLFSSSSYALVLVLGQGNYQSIETQIWFLTTALLDLPGAAALSITQLLIITFALWLSGRAQTRLTAALRLLPSDGARQPVQLRRDAVPLILTCLVAVFWLALPLLTLVWRSLHSNGSLSLENYRALATTGVNGTSLWQALQTSLVTATQATGISLFLGFLVALIASRRPTGRWQRGSLATLETAFLLPLGVSSVTVGFGYLITLNQPPFDLRSSNILIPIAQAVVALPLVVRALLPVLKAIDPRQLEAAATLGSGPFAVISRVELPNLNRAISVAVGFAFATSLGEFGATSFLARPDNPTLPVLIFRLFGSPDGQSFGQALAGATILMLIAGSIMILADHSRARDVAL